MTNSVYQVAVEALESVLSPRVVSRSLQEGLKQVGKTPESVAYRDLEKILKAQIYRQLQITMPVTQAKEKINDILAQIETQSPATADSDDGWLEAQQASLEELREALKPYNLYFEWPETQKLRTQLQLLESELEAGRESSKLVTNTKLQLKLVEQKLEDQLVIQARELGELESGLTLVKSLGGPKVRRLDNLIGQIREAQSSRQLAGGEVERARKFVTDLRKLLESSVVVSEPEPAAAPEADSGLLDVESSEDALLSIDTEGLPPEVSARLLLLDLESEQHELETLEKTFGNLLQYQPDWQAQLSELRERLGSQTSLGSALSELREALQKAQESQRNDLQAELSSMREGLDGVNEAVSDELKQWIQVALGVLETTLPPRADIEQIRQLHRLAAGRNSARWQDEVETGAARHAEQIAELHQLEQELGQYRGIEHEELEKLTTFLQQARRTLEEGHAVESLDPAWTLLDTLRGELERRVSGFEPRLDRALASLEQVARLNTEEAATVQRILHHLDSQRSSLSKVSARVRSGLETSLSEAEKLLADLHEQYEATRAIAGQLVSGNVLDDILGIFDETAGTIPAAPGAPVTSQAPASPTVVTKLKSRNTELDAWLEGYLNERGIRGAATFNEAGQMLAGRLELEPQAFGEALAGLEADLTALGSELNLGERAFVTLETPGHILIATWPNPQYRLVLVLDMPAMLNLILGKLRRDLPTLANIFSGPAFA